MISSREKNLYSFAFYNLENLYDTVDNPETLDDDFTEISDKKWSQSRLDSKVLHLGKTISQLGYSEINHPPLFIGVAEVENEIVLKALVTSEYLQHKNYGYVHFDSPDERGIDNAFLYRKDYFTVIHSEAFQLLVNNEFGERDYTRDILYVKGVLENETFHILINHWPSRRDGADKTNYKRVAAAHRNREIISEIQITEPNANIIIMGDFNDDPQNDSINTLVGSDFYNPMETLLTKYEGSLRHLGIWNLFDQIIIAKSLLNQQGTGFRYEGAHIFNQMELREKTGKYKGNPFRTYTGSKYLGGASDHFPVYAIFSIQKNEVKINTIL